MPDAKTKQTDLLASAAVSGDPFRESDYFRLAEASMDRHWKYYVLPALGEIPHDRVIDLAIGHGRNTEYLRQHAAEVIGVDINQECLDSCATRFASADNVRLVKTDGAHLSAIESDSVGLIYCFDAMVHFEPDVVESYVADFARVLKPGARGFIHHSNWTRGKGQDFRSQPHWRNYMTKEMFAGFVANSGLEIVSQRVLGWDESIPGHASDPNFLPNSDCITVFAKPA